MKASIFILLLLYSANIFGQTDTLETEYALPGTLYSAPPKGLHLEAGFYLPFNETYYFQYDKLKLKIPLLLLDRWKIIAGYNTFVERYRFRGIDMVPPTVPDSLYFRNPIKTSRIEMIVLHSFNERFFAALSLEATSNGDFDQFLMSFDERYFGYRGIGYFGWKVTPMREWGFGLMYRKNIERTFALPVVIYNQTFNEKWGMEAIIPIKFLLRHNISPSSLLLFNAEFESTLHNVEFRTNEDHLKRIRISATAEYDRQIKGWIWMNVYAGYQYYFKGRVILQGDSDPAVSLRPTDGPVAGIGIFLSPQLKKAAKSLSAGDKLEK